ncbi:MAG: hypothetical protein CVT77_09950 [Alphaproteobacteria bacterium HGW-Alphaproteobacteria-16]|nr:MAG: hypothetical protein CVT77_09950 [Alphaproteobacteria bacterium HGW-Alphaproteobacteria-16]
MPRGYAVKHELRYLLAILYCVAGVAHLCVPAAFLTVMPAWVPWPQEVIWWTGVCEILGAAGLLSRRFRRLAAAMLALYAVCVFPANVQHAINDLGSGTGLSLWYHAPRLMAQPFIVLWALWAGDVWPGRGREPRPRQDRV